MFRGFPLIQSNHHHKLYENCYYDKTVSYTIPFLKYEDLIDQFFFYSYQSLHKWKCSNFNKGPILNVSLWGTEHKVSCNTES